jgi:hypothetical protein
MDRGTRNRSPSTVLGSMASSTTHSSLAAMSCISLCVTVNADLRTGAPQTTSPDSSGVRDEWEVGLNRCARNPICRRGLCSCEVDLI